LRTCGKRQVPRASPAVLTQYVILRKYFSHPSLVIYCCGTPLIKLKPRQQIGGGVLIANHLDQSLWQSNKKHSAPVRSYLLHSFLQVRNPAGPFRSHCKLCYVAEPKPIWWAKPAYFDFSSSNFTVRNHVLSTTGDALILR